MTPQLPLALRFPPDQRLDAFVGQAEHGGDVGAEIDQFTIQKQIAINVKAVLEGPYDAATGLMVDNPAYGAPEYLAGAVALQRFNAVCVFDTFAGMSEPDAK